MWALLEDRDLYGNRVCLSSGSTYSTAMASKLVVFGGTGFLGKRICQTAINRGWNVVSISGSGRKPHPYPAEDGSWIEKVQWKRGDIFLPESYKDELVGAKSVVHSIGILLENDSYKKIVGSEDGIINTVSQLFHNSGIGSTSKTENPMAKNPANGSTDTEEQSPVIDKTYARYNTESALVAAEALIENNKLEGIHPSFTYISADRGFPGLPSGYIQSKREAEYELYQLQPNIRPIFLRPGFMYDPSEAHSGNWRNKIKTSLDLLNAVNDKLMFNALDGIVRPSISTVTVAKWCLDKIEDDEFHGPVMFDEMVRSEK